MLKPHFTRGRARLFASSSLAISALGALGAGSLALAPGAAFAANECGAPSGGVVTCTSAGNPYPNGISYAPASSLTLNLNPDVLATGPVNVLDFGAGTIVVNNNGSISLPNKGFGPAALSATGQNGPVTVTSNLISTAGLNGGINAYSAGAVTVTANSVLTNGPGVYIHSGTTATANTTTVATNGFGHEGVKIDGLSGAALTFGTITTNGGYARGVLAFANSGPVTVTGTSVSTVGDTSAGIYAQGNNAVTVNVGSVSTNGVGSRGVLVEASKAASATVTNVTTLGAGSEGLRVLGDSAYVNSTGSIVTHGASHYGFDSTGVVARAFTGPATVNVNNVTTYGANAQGVNAYGGYGQANVAVNGAVTTHGDNASGIVVTSYSSGVSVTGPTTSSVSTSGAYSRGIDAQVNGKGAGVTINVGQVTTTGTPGGVFGPDSTAIFARTHDGAISITDASVSTAGAYADGVNALSYSGPVSVTSASNTTTGVHADGISAISNYGANVTVTSTNTSTSGDFSNGIYAIGRQGTVNVSGGNVTTAGTQARGIYALSGKGTTVTFGAIATNGGFADGVNASATSGNVSVTGAGVTTNGVDALGVYASSTTGNATVNVGTVSTSGGNAIDAQAPLGSANVTVGSVTTAAKIGGAGVIANGVTASVVSTGSISTTGANQYGDNGAGVLVTSTTGPASASVNNVSTSGANSNGVDVRSTGGAVNVIAAGQVTTTGTNATGIYADSVSGNTTVNVTGAGVTSAQGVGVYARGGSITIDTAPGSTISGKLDGVLLNATTGSTVNNAGTVSAPAGAFAIDAATAPVTVNNTGAIDGAVRLAAGGDTVNNSGTFNATANSYFGPGDVFNNSGTVNVLPGAHPVGNVTFSGLTSFNNTGPVNLSNGRAGDTFTLGSAAAPTAFNGGAGSLLSLDVALGAASQTSCAAPTVADCLVLPGGTATGQTGILITNVASTLPGGLNTTGIVVVDAPGGAIAPGAFVLAPTGANYETRGGAGAISDGFFFYRLVPIGTTQEALVSAPDNTAFQFVELGAAATDIWYTTTGTWLDRQGDMRNTVANLSDGNHPGVWLKAVGDWTRRNLTQKTTSLGTTFTFNTGYQQDTAALIGGVDLLRGGGDHTAWVLGPGSAGRLCRQRRALQRLIDPRARGWRGAGRLRLLYPGSVVRRRDLQRQPAEPDRHHSNHPHRRAGRGAGSVHDHRPRLFLRRSARDRLAVAHRPWGCRADRQHRLCADQLP